MDLFTRLFGSLLAFVYHCFDRIVIYGYLSGLSRPERVVNYFHPVVGVPVVSKEILSQRTADCQNWVEAFARNHRFPIEWAEKTCARKTMSCRGDVAWCGRIATASIASSRAWSRGRPFVSPCQSSTKDVEVSHPGASAQPFTHYYFYIRDETLGPMVMRVASSLPFQTAMALLNGYSFIEQELNRARIGFRKIDNAFLAGG